MRLRKHVGGFDVRVAMGIGQITHDFNANYAVHVQIQPA